MLAVILTPWLQARQLYRFAVRQGTCRTVVRETGIEVATDHSTMTVRWPMVPRYRETPQLFVLFSGDKQATGITMLPKRAVRGQEELDRLRACSTATYEGSETGEGPGAPPQALTSSLLRVRALRAGAEDLHRMGDVHIPVLGGDRLRPLLHRGPSTSTALPHIRHTRW